MTDMLLDQQTREEIAEATDELACLDPLKPWVPSEHDEREADRYLRAYRFYTAALASLEPGVNELADAEIARIEAWRAEQTKDARSAIGYLTYRLRSLSEETGRGTRTSPAGVLKWKKGSTSIVVDDPDEFCMTHAGTALVRVKPAPDPEPDKKAIAAQIRDTGEIPDGADQVRGDSKFVIDVPALALSE